jgi:hypothetical protein
MKLLVVPPQFFYLHLLGNGLANHNLGGFFSTTSYAGILAYAA